DHSQRVLIVLDQFEQWLHAKREEANTELAQALRQCDGERVKAIIMVRADGDFWMEVHRFLRELHIEVQGQNSAAVALFEPRHARRVLIAFGQAFEALDEKLSKDQESFVDKAIQGLAENGRIMPVRLALFADMVKDKPWTQSTFKDVGGAEGVGVLFLEEKFNSTTLKPHRRAAQALLKALLPEEGTEIKGQKRSVNQLLEISGYRSRPADFHDLLHVLNNECRLITPATYDADSPDLKEGDGDGLPVAARFYQLTHDYLVPSLREWLDREQQKTRRGRAEKLLASRASMWKHERADRFLPSLREYLVIRILTQKRDWTEPQKLMMHRSRQVQLSRGAALLVVLIILGVAGFWYRTGQLEDQAREAVERLREAHIARVPRAIEHLSRYRARANRLLRQVSGDSDRERLNVALALLPTDQGQLGYLTRRLLVFDPDAFPVLQRLLSPYREALEEPLWQVLESETAKSDERLFPAACFLAESARNDIAVERWKKSASLVADQMLDKLVQEPGHFIPVVDAARPASRQLLDPLLTIYRKRDPNDPNIGAKRLLARSILVTYFLENSDAMAAVLAEDDDPRSYNATFGKLPNGGRPLIKPMFDQLSQPLSPRAAATDGAGGVRDVATRKKAGRQKITDRDLEDHARRLANAAVTLIRLGQENDKVWDLLRRAHNPRTRSYIIDRLGPFGVAYQSLIERALSEDEDVSVREALLLALGEFSLEKLTETERIRLCDKLAEVYHRHPDPGLHGASRWLLAKLAQGDRVTRIDGELAGFKPPAGQRWYVNSQHQTMVVIPGPVEFEIGSPFNEPFREVGSDSGVEQQHRVRIERGYAIAAQEVTVEDFMAGFSPMHNVDRKRLALGPDGKVDPRCPINNISWYQAAAYCNWLSKQDGIPENQWCYKPNKNGEYASGMKPTDNYLSLTGYRLPTEAEWEYACRAGTTTMRYYGQADELLEKYAWFEVNSMNPENSAQQLQPVGRLKPNELGLFDTLGNALEWCQDEYKKPEPTAGKSYPLVVDNPDASEVNDAQFRIARGEKFLGKRESIRAARRDHKHSPKAQDFIMGLRPARTHPANP
ncbi:MAG: SUMF1/EgtB/PvdO family nonheme iron enzyme, partial [Isosphaeraceae bacterium]